MLSRDGTNDAENAAPINNTSNSTDPNEYKLRTFQSTLSLLAHIFIGITVGISLAYAFRNGLPITATPIHVVLCVLGYHLLMAEAILSLNARNGWSSHLRLVDKRRAHWILQILGSSLAIAGSFVKILDKTAHWETLHGKFALVALVFTSVSLFNGLASLWSYEVRRFIPPKLSKATHICFGIVAFVAATFTLCYGFEKGAFTSWSGPGISNALISLVAAYTFIIIVNPVITFVARLRN